MKKIALTQDQFALVDDSDYELISSRKWFAFDPSGYRKLGRFYAATRRPRPDNGLILMHKFLTGYPMTDHIDGNGLNNCRGNLRPATPEQNCRAFKRKPPGTTSRFRGVSFCSERRKWSAAIHYDDRTHHLGRFLNEEDAARAYDAAARKYFVEFASPNFP